MNKFDLKNYIYLHFKENVTRYYLILFSSLIGIVIGIILSLNGFSHTSLLKITDKTLIDFIAGTVNYGDIFLSSVVKNTCIILIIFVFNLVWQTAFLNYVLICYQTSLVVLVANAIMSLYGISGIINSALIIFPLNLLYIMIYSYLACICMKRASDCRSLNLPFGAGFKNVGFWAEFAAALIMLFVFSLIYSFILPIFIKSFVLITY